MMKPLMVSRTTKDYETKIVVIFSIIAIIILFLISTTSPTEPKTFEDTYNKAYEQCLTEQQNNTKITNKEYYCVNYATAKVG